MSRAAITVKIELMSRRHQFVAGMANLGTRLTHALVGRLRH
jgi:hypothetical protein